MEEEEESQDLPDFEGLFQNIRMFNFLDYQAKFEFVDSENIKENKQGD